MLEKPKVTVLMPVYNGEKYLREAIDSIFNQTFTDFEFLIINDGSTDKSEEIIKSYDDPRISLFQNKRNLGLVATLNIGIELARGKYIARMDCDDISLSERLKKQVSFMEKHPEIAACGTWVKTMGEEISIWRYPVTNDEIRCKLLFESSLAHPSVIIRKSSLLESNLRYRSAHIHAEDYDLWVNMSKTYLLANIDEVLLKYRLHTDKIGAIHNKEQVGAADEIRRSQLADLGIEHTDNDLILHLNISNFRYLDSEGYLLKILNWLMKIEKANGERHIYNQQILHKELAYRWLVIFARAPGLELKKWKVFWSSPLSNFNDILSFLKERYSYRGRKDKNICGGMYL